MMRILIALFMLSGPATADQIAYDKFVQQCADMKVEVAKIVPHGISIEEFTLAQRQKKAAEQFISTHCSDWFLGLAKQAPAYGRKN